MHCGERKTDYLLGVVARTPSLESVRNAFQSGGRHVENGKIEDVRDAKWGGSTETGR